MTLAITGSHGAGKSTLGRSLAARLGWPFHDEVGWELAQGRGLDEDATQPQIAFDEWVFSRERDRDRRAPADRVVETWHPGNLAYAGLRSPGVVRAWLPEVRRATSGEVLVVHLHAPASVLAARKHEPGPAEFFVRVGREVRLWTGRLGLPELVLHSNVHCPDELVELVIARIQEGR